MIIFLRGLPGSGKTTIANLLSDKKGWKVISIDEYKKEIMKEYPEAHFITEIVPLSYKRALEEIDKVTGDVIVEEILRNKDFVEQLNELNKTKKVETKWFKIVRNMEDIVKTNAERKRKVKPTSETLIKMNEQLNSIVIEGEIVINNESPEDSVEKILSSL